MDWLRRLWRFLNAPVDDLWLFFVVAVVLEGALLLLVYYANPWLDWLLK